MKRTPLLLLLILLSCSPALCQFDMFRPDYCGTPGRVVALPPDITFAVNHETLDVDLFVRKGAPGIRLDYMAPEQICPLPDGRLVVFGNPGTGMRVSIVDTATATLLDSFIAYHPLLSPNQRWIIGDKFTPRNTESASSEYLLYDLSRSPAQNRAAGPPLPPISTEDIGTPIYPPGWKNEPGDNIGAPEEQQHGFNPPFFWAPDSSAVMFADSLSERDYLVYITISDRAVTRAYVHPFPGKLECDDPDASARGETAKPTGVQLVEFGPLQQTDRVLFVDFTAEGCSSAATVFGLQRPKPV